MELSWAVITWEGYVDPEILEAMACREGLALPNDLCLGKIRVASDCLNVVKAIGEAGMGQHGRIIREIRTSMQGFQAAKVVHEGRAANGDAHKLARGSVYDVHGAW